jgi:hypothetical protein
VWHHYIGDQQIDRLPASRLDHPQRLLAIGRHQHRIPLREQDGAGEITHQGLIFDQEYRLRSLVKTLANDIRLMFSYFSAARS